MKDKIALVTGGTSGIGRAAAIAFANAGADVVIVGRRETEGLTTAKLVQQAGRKALFFRADVSNESECKQMVKATIEKFGRLDFAFNNAGVEGQMGPLVEATNENYRTVMDINVFGVLASMKYQIPAILKSGGGAIVNNASVASLIGMAGTSIYAASKCAVVGLTRAASVEMATQKIRINAVSPGGVQTEMYDRFTGGQDAVKEQMNTLHPIGRVGTPNEIADLVVFLCSEKATFITGQNIAIDGGLSVP